MIWCSRRTGEMQHDEVVWQIINHGFCSFKTKIAAERTFCQNPYNVTGLCIRSACPLANSRYATIREEDGIATTCVSFRLFLSYVFFWIAILGICYLYIKTIERAHTPKKLWEKIKVGPYSAPNCCTQILPHTLVTYSLFSSPATMPRPWRSCPSSWSSSPSTSCTETNRD